MKNLLFKIDCLQDPFPLTSVLTHSPRAKVSQQEALQTLQCECVGHQKPRFLVCYAHIFSLEVPSGRTMLFFSPAT